MAARAPATEAQALFTPGKDNAHAVRSRAWDDHVIAVSDDCHLNLSFFTAHPRT
jgi:hypothetical protein